VRGAWGTAPRPIREVGERDRDDLPGGDADRGVDHDAAGTVGHGEEMVDVELPAVDRVHAGEDGGRQRGDRRDGGPVVATLRLAADEEDRPPSLPTALAVGRSTAAGAGPGSVAAGHASSVPPCIVRA
jgi:hypothetical protein